MRRFSLGPVFGLAAPISVYLSLLAVLSYSEPSRLPAPAISTTEQMDEKLRYLRGRQTHRPNLLAVGSSVAWMHLDGAILQRDGSKRFLNGGTAAVAIHETAWLSRFYLSYLSEVETVLFVTAAPDFTDCSSRTNELFSEVDAARYAFKNWPAALMYVKYFEPRRYLSRARRMPFRQYEWSTPWLDEYGTNPVIVSESNQLALYDTKRDPMRLRYGAQPRDLQCVGELGALAEDLKGKGKKFIVVFTPVNPRFRETIPDITSMHRDLVAEVARRLEPTGAIVAALNEDPAFETADFWDAYHLQWAAARKFSEKVEKIISLVGNGLDSRRAIEGRGQSQTLESYLLHDGNE